MNLPVLLLVTAITVLSACSSTPSFYPEQGIGSPSQGLEGVEQGIASPVQALKLEETEKDEEEMLPAQPEPVLQNGNN